MTQNHTSLKRKVVRARKAVLVMFLTAFLVFSVNPPAGACGNCTAGAGGTSTAEWVVTTKVVNDHTTSEVTAHQVWLVSILWEDNLLPALMMMANQLTAVAMQQTMIIGSFLDAKHQMETQRLLQTIRAKAHKDYHPSAGVCEFGSSVRSLAASERKAELTSHVLSQRSQDRHLGNVNTAAAAGASADKEGRLKQYREKFCDPADNNNGLLGLCEHDQDDNPGNSTRGAAAPGGIGASNRERMNKDIDYVRTIDYPWTLNVDFSDTTLTDHEEELLALSNNLYGSEVFKRMPAINTENKPGTKLTAAQANYMDARALLAKRSVAENSFNAITSMKSAGTASSREFLESILKELGVTTNPTTTGNIDEIRRLLGYNSNDPAGAKIGPSYNAQMEILTRKIYQNPDFYTNLYDKPANIARKEVAMQAIALMQKFDLFKSYLRAEANMSVLLELAVQDTQNDVENLMHKQKN
ncbi:MAG: hypothetical protein IT559_08525 [Alphaproteobacteria bacterium]|nr:hypothetical protein [Alphaproteobacteria bacterium]